MRLREVVPQVYQVPVRGASIFRLGHEEITIIDAGMRGSGRQILEAVREVGRSPEDIGEVIVTHCQYDHTAAWRNDFDSWRRACGSRPETRARRGRPRGRR